MNPSNQPSLVPGSRRGKAGRPRKGDTGIFSKPQLGHKAGTVAVKSKAGSGVNDGAQVKTTVVPCQPRLLDLDGAAAYLSVSTWKIREMEQVGVISRVRIPLGRTTELRKLLFDKAELDRLIESWKER